MCFWRISPSLRYLHYGLRVFWRFRFIMVFAFVSCSNQPCFWPLFFFERVETRLWFFDFRLFFSTILPVTIGRNSHVYRDISEFVVLNNFSKWESPLSVFRILCPNFYELTFGTLHKFYLSEFVVKHRWLYWLQLWNIQYMFLLADLSKELQRLVQ